jgi:uncharacterized membrane protein YeaQ/YmgE (transglycosylase-associated protein family)
MTGVGIFGLIIIGLIAGYVAEKLTESNHGLFTNLVVGLVGAFVGGFIANLFGMPPRIGFLANLVVATLGAILFLYTFRRIRGRQQG